MADEITGDERTHAHLSAIASLLVDVIAGHHRNPGWLDAQIKATSNSIGLFDTPDADVIAREATIIRLALLRQAEVARDERSPHRPRRGP
jgi:hypothetical protein